MKAYFEQLFGYDRWANDLIFSLIRQTRPKNDRIYELFSHVISAQRIWLDRCLGRPDSTERFSDRSVPEMEHDLRVVSRSWSVFFGTKDDAGFTAVVDYTNTQNQPFHQPLHIILTQVVNHGTHHRGQILQLIKNEGFEIPNTDFIRYIRLQNP